jgi:hypothetical protein
VTSAGNERDGQGAIFVLTDFTVRKDSILTRNPKGCADPVAEVSDPCSVGKPPHH